MLVNTFTKHILWKLMEDTSPVLGGPTLALAVLILDRLDVNSKSLSKSSWLTELDAMPAISLQCKNPLVTPHSGGLTKAIAITVCVCCAKRKKWVLTKNTWTSEQRVGRLWRAIPMRMMIVPCGFSARGA